MARTERLSVSLNKKRVEGMRALISSGTYPNMSAALDEATALLLHKQDEERKWWDEIKRRCDEAEQHPEKLLDADTFFREVRSSIQKIKTKASGA